MLIVSKVCLSIRTENRLSCSHAIHDGDTHKKQIEILLCFFMQNKCLEFIRDYGNEGVDMGNVSWHAQLISIVDQSVCDRPQRIGHPYLG